MTTVDLSAAARVEVERLSRARALVGGARPVAADGPLVAIARRRRIRATLGRRVLLLCRSVYEDGSGRVVHSRVLGLAIAVRSTRRDICRIDWSGVLSLSDLHTHCSEWREAVEEVATQFASRRRMREKAIASARTAAIPLFQPGLFDRRAHRAHLACDTEANELAARLAARAAAAEYPANLRLRPPELLLVLIPRDAAGV